MEFVMLANLSLVMLATHSFVMLAKASIYPFKVVRFNRTIFC